MKKVFRIVCLFFFLFAAWYNCAAAGSLDVVCLSQDNSAPQPVLVFKNPYLKCPEMALDNPAIQETLKDIYPNSLWNVSTFKEPVLPGFEDPFFLWCGSYGSQPFPLPRPKPDLWPDRPYCGSDGSDQPWPKPRCPEPQLWPWDPKPWCPEPEPWPCGPRPYDPWAGCPLPWDPWSPYHWYYRRNEGIETIPRIRFNSQVLEMWGLEWDPIEEIMKRYLIKIEEIEEFEKNMKQPWIRIDNEEWDSEKIMKQPWIWHIDWEMIKKIEEIMKQPLYPERPQYIPHTPEQASRL